MSETSEITRPLLQILKQIGILSFRMQSGVLKKGNNYIHMCEKGTADILCFPRGRVVWLETKKPKGHTNKEQIENQAEFKRKVTELGHEYYRITSIDEGLSVLNHHA